MFRWLSELFGTLENAPDRPTDRSTANAAIVVGGGTENTTPENRCRNTSRGFFLSSSKHPATPRGGSFSSWPGVPTVFFQDCLQNPANLTTKPLPGSKIEQLTSGTGPGSYQIRKGRAREERGERGGWWLREVLEGVVERGC